MKFKSIISLLALALILSPLAFSQFSQSKETGAIVGTIMDEETTPLPGVNVSLSSPKLMGDRSTVTNTDGAYRFPALPPGTYSIRAELQGFATTVRENIRLNTTVRLTVDLTLKVSAIEEEITVIAISPTVDVKTSETASITLSDELLRGMPSSQFVPGLVNMAPGVNDGVAYGSSDSTGIAYQVDGVDVSDPEGGSAWAFLDYNIIEEAKIMGVGLNAEYGAFTGVIFNTITKSGGNDFSGHAELIYQDNKKGFWTAENNQDYIDDFPDDLESPTSGIFDTSFHLGGPIAKDKVWFFIGAQWYVSKEKAAGYLDPDGRVYEQPRFIAKISSQLSSKFNLMAYIEYDGYFGRNRRGGATHPTADTCVRQPSDEWLANFNLTAILSPNTFIDVKGTWFTGYYYLLTQIDDVTVPAVWSTEDWRWYDNTNWEYWADRGRAQVNASLSHYAEDFIQGNHDFKFGTELEYGRAHSWFSYTGYVEGIGSNVYIYDWYGYLYAYQYEGYDWDNDYTRNEWFIQDAWSITDNVTLNLGARYSMMRGRERGVSGTLYSANRLAPRVGFAWDIFGDHTTVLKAHYGQYTEAMYTGIFYQLNSSPDAWSDFVGWYEWDGVWYEMFRDEHNQVTQVDSLKHPYMDQYTVAVERELFKDASLGVTFIYRSWKDIMGTYDVLAEYELIPWEDYTGTTYNVWNLPVVEHQYVQANIKKGDPYIPDDAYRTYRGLQLTFTKRFSNRWQLIASYVLSETKGTMDNSFGEDIGWHGKDNPNNWINAKGNVTYDPTHMIKLQGSYVLPLDIHFNASFSYITGNTWTHRARFSGLGQGRVTINAEPRGSRRYDDQMNLDLRLEKTFTFADKYRVGLMIDIFNVFNDNTITSWGTIAGSSWNPDDPEAPGPNGHDIYNLVDPRSVRLGIRLFF
jgi:hypothetical protein